MKKLDSTKTVYRDRALEIRNVQVRADGESGEDLLELEFAFASETPVPRYFGSEELEVTTKAARLDRVSQGVVPVLANHFSTDVVGRVLSVTIGSDRIARAHVRFSRSALARDVVQDVVDGIRQGVSFGYRVHKMELIESGDDGDRFRVVDWEIFEITIASMPADPSVGVHRSADERTFAPVLNQAQGGRKERTRMTLSYRELAELDDPEFEEHISTWPEAKRTAAREHRRRNHIETIITEFKVSDSLRDTALREDWDTDRLLKEVRAERGRGGHPLSKPDTDRGWDAQDTAGYSFIGHAVEAYEGRRGANSELADFVTRGDERPLRGRHAFRTSLELLSADFKTRAVGKTTGGGVGASLVGVQHRDDLLIDLFRIKSAVLGLGVEMLPGLIGDQSFPKQTAGAGTEWVGEGAGSGTPGEPAFGSLAMSPRTLRGRVDITRRMRLQGTPAVEQITRNDFFTGMALAIEAAILNGAGTTIEPEGILNTTGVGAGSYVTTSGASEYQSFIDLAALVEDANVNLEGAAFLLTPTTRGRLMTKYVDPGSGLSVWKSVVDREMGEIAGSPAATSNNLPKNLGVGTNEHAIIFGLWSNILLGLWSTVDIVVDDVTLGDSGGLVLRAFQDVDVLIRNPEAFATMSVNPAA